jgi:hypothetical protein
VDEGWLGWVGGVNIYRRGVSDCEVAEPIEGEVVVIGGWIYNRCCGGGRYIGAYGVGSLWRIKWPSVISQSM